MRRIVTRVLLIVAVGGCSAPIDPEPMPTPTARASTPADEGTPGPRPKPTPVTQPLTASDDGLTVRVKISSPVVAPGQSVRIEVSIRNDGTTQAVLTPGLCDGIATISGWLDLPAAPSGRSWTGLSADYKSFVLEQGLVDGGRAAVSARPMLPGVTAFWCPAEGHRTTLDAGAEVQGAFELRAELVPGVPALEGDLAFTVLVQHDPVRMPRPSGVFGGGRPAEQVITLNGTVAIVGDSPRLLSTGEVIDALLTDGRFQAWLSRQPSTTWSVANLFLQNIGGAQGIVPAGPSWEVDLFRENGVPRNWAIGFIDPFTGTVSNLAFCDDPCKR